MQLFPAAAMPFWVQGTGLLKAGPLSRVGALQRARPKLLEVSCFDGVINPISLTPECTTRTVI